MGQLKNSFLDDEEDLAEQDITEEKAYPVQLKVDGYDVNHFYEGDVPVYEIYDHDGKVLDVAHSTNEMHEITGSLNKNTEGA